MRVDIQTDAPPFGLFEISEQGIIRHYQPPADTCVNGMGPELAGRNFYNTIAPGRCANELRERVIRFRLGGSPTESFDFPLSCGDGELMVRVLLTTVQERTAEETTKSVLIHIRPA